MTKRTRKIIAIMAVTVAVLLFVLYFVAEGVMMARIRSVLRSEYPNGYAVLRLHMGGESYETPSLMEMLRLVHEYKTSDEYQPQGSAGLTGKKHYLTILVSDNRAIQRFDWSFRKFSLIKGAGEAPCDIIANLPDKDQPFYQYRNVDLVCRADIWYVVANFNHPDSSFYYRAMRPEVEKR